MVIGNVELLDVSIYEIRQDCFQFMVYLFDSVR